MIRTMKAVEITLKSVVDSTDDRLGQSDPDIMNNSPIWYYVTPIAPGTHMNVINSTEINLEEIS